MKLMTKGWVAVPAMVDLAMHHDSGPVTLAEISERQRVSLSYLEQLFCKLRRNELVRSVHGPGGGYHLNKDASQVSVADIIVAVDGPKEASPSKANGREGDSCVTPDFWNKLDDQIFDYLGGVTLQQLIEEQRAKEESDGEAAHVLGEWAPKPAEQPNRAVPSM